MTLWGVPAVIGLAFWIGILLIPFTVGVAPRATRTLVGVLILVGVVVLGLGAKAAEAFINWREGKESQPT